MFVLHGLPHSIDGILFVKFDDSTVGYHVFDLDFIFYSNIQIKLNWLHRIEFVIQSYYY